MSPEAVKSVIIHQDRNVSTFFIFVLSPFIHISLYLFTTFITYSRAPVGTMLQTGNYWSPYCRHVLLFIDNFTIIFVYAVC